MATEMKEGKGGRLGSEGGSGRKGGRKETRLLTISLELSSVLHELESKEDVLLILMVNHVELVVFLLLLSCVGRSEEALREGDRFLKLHFLRELSRTESFVVSAEHLSDGSSIVRVGGEVVEGVGSKGGGGAREDGGHGVERWRRRNVLVFVQPTLFGPFVRNLLFPKVGLSCRCLPKILLHCSTKISRTRQVGSKFALSALSLTLGWNDKISEGPKGTEIYVKICSEAEGAGQFSPSSLAAFFRSTPTSAASTRRLSPFFLRRNPNY